MDLDEFDAEPIDWSSEPETSDPKQSPPMYQPDEPPQSDASQWEPYDATAFPPQDDFAIPPEPPPGGRTYGMYRQPPTWQHASLSPMAGWNDELSNWGGLLQGLSAIAASAGLGYVLTKSPKTAAGAGLGMIGVLQVPLIFRGALLRPALGIAALFGAYFLLQDDLQVAVPNWGGGEDDDDDDDDDDEDDEEDDEEDEDERPAKTVPKPKSPWLGETD